MRVLACKIEDFTIDLSNKDSETAAQSGIENLTTLAVSPDLFLLEPKQYWLPRLSPKAFTNAELFDQQLSILSHIISKISIKQIEVILHQLYEEAYQYNATTQTMQVGSQSEQQRAKEKLDLWIGAIYRQAYIDEDFARKISINSIDLVIQLNSKKLNPKDRGTFYRFSQNELSFSQIQLEDYRTRIAWIQTYKGDLNPWNESNYFSKLQLQASLQDYLGKKEYEQRRIKDFPFQEFDRWLSNQDDKIKIFFGRTPVELTNYFFELRADFIGTSSQSDRIALFQTGELAAIALERNAAIQKKPLGYWPEEFHFRQRKKSGISRKEAAVFYYNPLVTDSKLDDYNNRWDLLDIYEDIYSKIFFDLPEKVFSEEKYQQLIEYQRLYTNKAIRGSLISSEDLKSRRQTARENLYPLHRIKNPFLNALRCKPPLSLKSSYAITPHCFHPQLRQFADQIVINSNLSVQNLIQSTTDFIIFTPETFYRKNINNELNSEGTTLQFFGLIFLIEEKTKPTDYCQLLYKIGHDAQHIRHYLDKLDHEPERAFCRGSDERNAYLITQKVLSYCRTNSARMDQEAKQIDLGYEWSSKLVRKANEYFLYSPDDNSFRDDLPKAIEDKVCDLDIYNFFKREILEELKRKI